ncbi:MAG: D-alanyl-D-alanine carboxypeptidase, partial [Clostridia bacterium]|nr:D-alanyl-D-alanine carboxypeptidase [Clostridia bacterium]
MASTTKIMTAFLAAEYIESAGEDVLTVVSDTAAGIEGSSIYLKIGETVRLADLLYATLLASANDAAAALAEAVAGSQENFVLLMNERAREWGLVATHFVNVHGLSDTEHYTTAYELGVIASHALQNGLFARVVKTKHYTFVGEGITRQLSNHNRMLFSYQGAIGVKTGFTKATGRCLVTAAERDGVCLIAVTLSAPNDWNDHAALLDYGFSRLEKRLLLRENEISLTLSVVGGRASSVAVTNAQEVSAVLPKGQGELTQKIELLPFAYASVAKGDVLGRIVFYDAEKAVAICELVAKEAVEAIEYEKTLSERILSFFGL